MSYYETDPVVLVWLESALVHATPRIRLSALDLLTRIDCADRIRWLERAQADSHSEVAAAAVLAEALAAAMDERCTDLFESDFASGLDCDDLRWEWEYEVLIAHEFVVQGCTHRVWTCEEDDHLARTLALHKAYAGKLAQAADATALIVDKRVVNQYTRSPRSSAEARLWGKGGRPRYRE